LLWDGSGENELSVAFLTLGEMVSVFKEG
jgi:hypothetical protein